VIRLVAAVGRGTLLAGQAVGRSALVVGRTLRALPRMNGAELLRSLAHFGWESLGICLWVAVVIGVMVVVQSGLYVNRFGARVALGWASGFAVIWEFGPLLLGLVLAARVGARNAAELASLKAGGQLEGLSGISLDPYPVLLAPRWVAITVSTGLLASVTLLVAVLVEVVSAWGSLGIPPRVFTVSLAEALGWRDVLGGTTKSVAFGAAVATVSTAVGLRASGGARGVGLAAASAVVLSSFSIFGLDLLLTPVLAAGLAR
jgi:phospholipid/cholesterol/gamma-HCH transport system permease protein